MVVRFKADIKPFGLWRAPGLPGPWLGGPRERKPTCQHGSVGQMDVLGRVLLALIQRDTCLVGAVELPLRERPLLSRAPGNGCVPHLGGCKRLAILSLGLIALTWLSFCNQSFPPLQFALSEVPPLLQAEAAGHCCGFPAPRRNVQFSGASPS